METWAPVHGYEGLYEVSDRGRVKSLTLRITDTLGRTPTRPGRIRKLQVRPDGHVSVDLKTNNNRKTFLVHRLVAEAFLPNPDGLPLVRHLNDVPGDNRVENLAWGTKSDNARDAVKNGLHFWAKRDSCSRGHLYTEDSYYWDGKQRNCRECRREDYGVKEPKKHGTYSGYVTFGCRCGECVRAGREYRASRSRRERESRQMGA